MAQKCVHQGCGKQFTDPTEKCEYHPGPPVFHEGQKGQSRYIVIVIFIDAAEKAGSAASLES
jgi:hypothetical protein